MSAIPRFRYRNFPHRAQASAMLPRSIPDAPGSRKRIRNLNTWGKPLCHSPQPIPALPRIACHITVAKYHANLLSTPAERKVIGAEAGRSVDRPKVAISGFERVPDVGGCGSLSPITSASGHLHFQSADLLFQCSMQALDSYLLMDRGEMWPALAYMVGSVVLSIAGLFAGLQMIRAVS
jgi:hypothetical protein